MRTTKAKACVIQYALYSLTNCFFYAKPDFIIHTVHKYIFITLQLFLRSSARDVLHLYCIFSI